MIIKPLIRLTFNENPDLILKNFAYFVYQKYEFQKQRKITAKNLTFFSNQKINACTGKFFNHVRQNLKIDIA